MGGRVDALATRPASTLRSMFATVFPAFKLSSNFKHSGGTMISTFFTTRKRLNTRVWVVAGSIAVLACGRDALAQSSAPSGGFLEHEAVTPALLFREV